MKTAVLGELVEIRGGGTPSKDVPAFWGGEVPWASVKDFKDTILRTTIDRISEAGVANSATQVIPAGNVIVPTRMAVGKAAINAVDMAINQDLKALIPKSSLNVRYLLHAVLANARLLEDQATGATVKGIKWDALRSLEIPLPPLGEQKRIAAILDQADALRRLRALDRLNALGQAIFHEMFGDFETLPSEPLDKLARVVTGRTPSTAHPALFCGEIPFVTPGDLERSETPKRQVSMEGARASQTVRPGATLVCCIGATV